MEDLLSVIETSSENDSENNDVIETNSHKNPPKIIYDNLNIIDYYTVEIDYEYEKRLGENLCEAFVISGLSKDKSEYIQNSFEYRAICKHSECSIFPAVKPSILYKFPNADSKHLEITNSVILFIFMNDV